MKKTALAILLIFTVMLCCSCMSDTEKEKAMEDVRAAKPIIENYISENYSGAKLSTINYLAAKKDPGPVPDFGIYASGYCIAEIEYGNDDFNVIADTDSGECWDNYGTDSLENELKQKLSSMIEGALPRSIDINISPCSLSSRISDSKQQGFYKIEDKNADAIIFGGNYDITAALKYDMPLSDISYDKLTSQTYKSSVTLQLLKFRDNSYAQKEILPRGESVIALSSEEQYLLLEESISFRTWHTESGSDDYVMELVSDSKYETAVVGDLTFAWKSNEITPDFTTTEAPDTMTTKYYSKKPFYRLSDTAALMSYSMPADTTRTKLYCYCAEKYSAGYFIALPLVGDNDAANNLTVNRKTAAINANTACVASFSVKNEENQLYTIGIYQKSE